MAPPIGVFTKTFADKTNDSRYDGTFTSVYRGNWNKSASTASINVMYNANKMPVYPGDAILSFLPDETLASSITYHSSGKSNIGAGEIPGRADWVISPRGINRQYYPGLWKIGTYRTDNGIGLGTPNGSTCRPFDVAKFSYLSLVVADVAVMCATIVAGKSAR